MVAHPDVAKVSFTGSVSTGKAVAAAAAKTLKRVTLELGGKSPLIVFSDADLEAAAKGALMGNFYTQGEVCSNGTRVFVHRSILDKFFQKLQVRLASIQVGDPVNPATNVGALISATHLDKVQEFIEKACAEGATLWFGGQRISLSGSNGNFMMPAILMNCSDEMKIVREEVFGPVMSVLVFDDEEEVIQRANNTRYGLCAGIFTRDIKRAHRVVARLEAGTCWINNYNLTPPGMPFGGVKNSGYGRENARATIDSYTCLKAIHVELGQVDSIF